MRVDVDEVVVFEFFWVEWCIFVLLDYFYIVKLIDVGVIVDGVLWFVMEFV